MYNEILYCYVLFSEGFLILVLNKSAFQKTLMVFTGILKFGMKKHLYMFIVRTGLKLRFRYHHLNIKSDVYFN